MYNILSRRNALNDHLWVFMSRKLSVPTNTGNNSPPFILLLLIPSKTLRNEIGEERSTWQENESRSQRRVSWRSQRNKKNDRNGRFFKRRVFIKNQFEGQRHANRKIILDHFQIQMTISEHAHSWRYLLDILVFDTKIITPVGRDWHF